MVNTLSGDLVFEVIKRRYSVRRPRFGGSRHRNWAVRVLAPLLAVASVASAQTDKSSKPPMLLPVDGERGDNQGSREEPSTQATPSSTDGSAAATTALTFEQAARVDELSLADLMDLDIKVTTATRSVAVTVENAPSIMSVVTREQIERYGYRSVPEALASVPGLFIVDDLVTSNLAIRGIHAGQDSWSRTVKFMVDGIPVQYQSNGGALVGPEYIPMDAVERIEIIRGPASALYGANAFLGVVNVITRTPDKGVRATLGTSGGGINGNLSIGDSALLSYRSEHKRPFWALAAVQAERLDRSGLAPGATSPQGDRYAGRTSEHDLSRPVAAFGKIGWQGREFGDARIETIYQQTDANALFSEIGVLEPDTRIARANSVTRLDYRLPLVSTYGSHLGWKHSLDLHAWGGYGLGRTLDRELLVTAGDRVHRARRTSNVDVGTEFNYQFDRHSILVGVDHQRVADDGDTLFDIDSTTGEGIQRNDPSPLDITNVGVFGQAMIYPWKPLAITGGIRLDENSVWGRAVTYRGATVLDIFEKLYLKAMVGTSFVPPAPSQLNAVPIVLRGGVEGNPNLDSQTARTYEAAVLARPLTDLELDLTIFRTQIFDRVENVAVGQLLRAENLTDSTSRGLELSGRWHYGPLTLDADVAYQRTELADPELTTRPWRLAYGEGAVGGKRPPNFPEWLSHQRVALTLPDQYVELAASGMYVSSRKATVANITFNGESYLLDPYFVFGLHVRTLGLELLRDRVTEVSLHANNLFGANYAHGGNYGVDIPAVGRVIFLRLKQDL